MHWWVHCFQVIVRYSCESCFQGGAMVINNHSKTLELSSGCCCSMDSAVGISGSCKTNTPPLNPIPYVWTQLTAFEHASWTWPFCLLMLCPPPGWPNSIVNNVSVLVALFHQRFFLHLYLLCTPNYFCIPESRQVIRDMCWKNICMVA